MITIMALQVADWKEHKLLCGTSTSEDGDRDGHGPELDCDLPFREEMTEKIT